MPITLPSTVAPNELIQSAWGNAVVAALAEIDLEFVEKGGDTMTGSLVVNGSVTVPTNVVMAGAYSSTVAGSQLQNDGPLASCVTNTAGGTDLTPNAAFHRWGNAGGQPSAAAGRYVTMNRQGTTIGTIEINGTGTGVLYQVTSDQRLKRDAGLTPDDGLDTLAAINVHRFHWGASENTELGLYAQELHEVLPGAVSVGGDDPVERPWGIGYGSQEIISHLVLAVQQLTARLAVLGVG